MKTAILADVASELLTTEEQDAYDNWANALDDEVITSCVAHLTCNGSPGVGCDIDPNVNGEQSCKVTSAAVLCTTHVTNLLQGQLELPGPEKYPDCSTAEYLTIEQGCPGYNPEMNATGGGCVADGVIPGGSDGADSTGAPADPFGDLGALISCSGLWTAPDCTLDPDLILNATENFRVFYDEGVELELVDSSEQCGPGAKLTGLDAGEDATALTDELGIENGDIVTNVGANPLTSIGRAAAALDEIATATSLTVIVKRRDGAGCDTMTYDLTVGE